MPYNPQWTNEVLGYTVKYLTRHQWRVRPQMELDDMLQEAFILFMQLLERYDFATPSHFMAMWKRCLRNEVHGWACKWTRMRQEHVSDKTLNNIPDRSNGNDAVWDHHVLEASGYVRKLLDSTKTRIRRPRRCYHDGTRLTTNEYLCRFAGVSAKVPLRRLFEEWLANT